MPVRLPDIAPPFNVVRPSQVELGVRDLAKLRALDVDGPGYLVTDPQNSHCKDP